MRVNPGTARPTVLAVLLGVGGLLAMLVADNVAVVLMPAVAAAEALSLWLGMRRNPGVEPARSVWIAYVTAAALAVPASAFFALAEVRGDHGALFWIGTANALTALLCAVLGGGITSAPLLRVPALSRALTVLLVGFVLGGLSLQWVATLSDGNQSLIRVLQVAAAFGALLSVGAAVVLVRRQIPMGRTNELWSIGAVVTFMLGQFVVVVLSQSTNARVLFGPAVIGLAMVAAGVWAPHSDRLGSPVPALAGERNRSTAPAVMVTVLSASIALLVPFSIGWGSRTTFAVSTVALLQAAALGFFLASRYIDRGTRNSHRGLRRALRNAVINGEIRPYYQPIFRAHDQVLAGYECLARWHHPSLGLLTASQFLDAAHDDALLDNIDRLMMRETLDHIDELLATTGVDEPFVSVNVHPRRFEKTDLVEEIGRELILRGRTGAGLVVELTEHASIGDWEQFTANVTGIQTLGVGVAVDDFGIGHANFALLLQIDPDIIKMDRVITDGAITTERGRALIKSAFEAAGAVGARVVAEGVEDPLLVPDLVSLGAHYLQGHAFGRAQPLAAWSARQ
jgi:EAL domain-containing protein (putative c-di-GMP-specific phosphodiesterase class I)